MKHANLKDYRPGDPVGLVTTDLLQERFRAKCRYCDWVKDDSSSDEAADKLKKHFREVHK